MQNPYDPPIHTEIETVKFHREICQFLHYSMLGGMAWPLIAFMGKYGLIWDNYWLPAGVLSLATLAGATRLFSTETNGKLMFGTLLIWIPFPIHAGVAACMFSSGLMERREFAFGSIPLHAWWGFIVAAIGIGWPITVCFLRNSQLKREETIGGPYFVASWAIQCALFWTIRYFW